jgi:hypothetical protein
MDEVIGHARDGKNERSFRINFFHPNDLVTQGKKTGAAQRLPALNLDCQRLPVVGIK